MQLSTRVTRGKVSSARIAKCISPGLGNLSLSVQTSDAGLKFLRPFVRKVFDRVGNHIGKGIHLCNSFGRLSLRNRIETGVSTGVSILGACFRVQSSSVRVSSNDLSFEGMGICSHRKRSKLMGNCLRRAGLGGLVCRFGVQNGGLLVCGACRTKGVPFCKGMCNAKGIMLSNKGGTVAISTSLAANGGADFACVAKMAARTTDGRFVAFMSGAPGHVRSGIRAGLCRRSGIHGAGRSSKPPVSLHVGVLVRTAPDTAVGVVVSPMTKSGVATAKGKGLRIGFFGGNSFHVFNDCIVSRNVCGLDVRRMVHGSFALGSNNAIAFSNSPCRTGLSLRTMCAIGSTSLDSLMMSPSHGRNAIGMGYLVGLAKGLSGPSVGFSLRLPAMDRRSQRLMHDTADARRRVGARVVCLLKVNGFCACSCTGGSRSSGTADSLTFDALSNRLGGVLSR